MGNFNIKFWGVRGTITTPVPTMMRYGGHTSCVEMRCGDRVLVFDAGTGIYPMGETPNLHEMDLFLSHTHLDHVIGFPFFSPLYRPDFTMRVWAGNLLPEMTLREALSRLMSPPLFPLTLDFPRSKTTYHDFKAGEDAAPHLAAEGIRVRTLLLPHPDRATGYRVEYQGKSACYITDIEHQKDGLNKALVEFIRGTDVFIYDSTFDDHGFEKFAGWGHSTWQEATRLADAAGVKQLVIFHHDPGMKDDALDARVKELQATRPNSLAAQEGLVIEL